MPGINGKADRQFFNPELVAIATAINNKCLRKGEYKASPREEFALHSWSERKKRWGVRERQSRVKHNAAQG